MPDRYLGSRIGKYRVIRLIGSGAFAWVYEAVDNDLDIPVALKILRPEFAGQADAEARFRREASTAAKLRHPNIVTVRDVGQVDTASFVAMDLLPTSLGSRLALLQLLPERQVVRIGLDVAAALTAAHAGGIIHRDIKPDNILFGARGEAIVADFGLARALSQQASDSNAKHVIGTPHYFSPEQARALELDGRSDLYALGVTLFRAATGRLPFEGDNWYEVARQHIETEAPSARAINPDLTEEFDALIARLLRKDPAARFPSAFVLVDELAALPTAPRISREMAVAHTDPSVTLPTPQLPATPITASIPVAINRRRRTIVVGVVAAALLALAFPSVRGVLTGRDAQTLAALDDTIAAALRDSINMQRADSTRRVDSIRSAMTSTTIPSRSNDSTHLTLRSSDSAQLSIDGVRVGVGSYVADRAGAVSYVVRAQLPGAPPNCSAATRDSTVKLADRERRTVQLSVRACVVVQFNVTPLDARVRFEPLEGGAAVETRVDSLLVLPVGAYRVRGSARRCTDYTDSLRVQQQPDGAPIVMRYRMTCN